MSRRIMSRSPLCAAVSSGRSRCSSSSCTTPVASTAAPRCASASTAAWCPPTTALRGVVG